MAKKSRALPRVTECHCHGQHQRGAESPKTVDMRGAEV